MIISLTYETQITVEVDVNTSTIISISVLKSFTSSPSGLDGYTHAEGIRPDDIPYPCPAEPFRREQVRKAVEILRTQPHPEWTFKEER